MDLFKIISKGISLFSAVFSTCGFLMFSLPYLTRVRMVESVIVPIEKGREVRGVIVVCGKHGGKYV